jgi:hypothetical protein
VGAIAPAPTAAARLIFARTPEVVLVDFLDQTYAKRASNTVAMITIGTHILTEDEELL